MAAAEDEDDESYGDAGGNDAHTVRTPWRQFGYCTD